MKQNKKKRKGRSASPIFMAELARKKAMIERIRRLIANIDELMARTDGPRYFTYKLRRCQAEMAIKRIKRSMRSKDSGPGRIAYVVNPKEILGGAPGLIQQHR